MKKNITKFDIDAAFKALDEIEIPKVTGLKANRLNLHESTKRVDRLSLLVEEYYNLGEAEDIDDAAKAREAEVAQAKLARIEKIVDLDAETEDDILPSYVGKTIIQCPQCMTLFYKDPADIIPSEDDPNVVNVEEVCQHCNNDSGYTVIGKVAAEENTEEPAATEEPVENETPVEEEQPEETTEENAENKPAEENNEEDLSALLPTPEEEEQKEESYVRSGNPLNEDVDSDLDKKLKEHNDYIEYLRTEINDAESKLNSTKNEFVKAEIQKTIDALKADLETALPEAVKMAAAESDLPDADEIPEEAVEETTTEETVGETPTEEPKEEKEANESLKSNVGKKRIVENKKTYRTFQNKCAGNKCAEEPVTEAKKRTLGDIEVTDDMMGKVAQILSSPVSDAEIEAYLQEDSEITESVLSKVNNIVKSWKEAGHYKDVAEGLLDPLSNIPTPPGLSEEKDCEKCEDCKEALVKNSPVNVNLNLDGGKGNDVDVIESAELKEEEKPENLSDIEGLFDDELTETLDADDLNEEKFNNSISCMLKDIFSNVKDYQLTGCCLEDNKLITEGVINFNSGKSRGINLEFTPKAPNILECNKSDIADETKINLGYNLQENAIIAENLQYECMIKGTKLSGKI